MEISSNNTISTSSLKTVAKGNGDTTATKASEPVVVSTVSSASEVTNSIKTMATALTSSASSDIDTAKVDKIRSAILSGEYKIDSSKIADGLIQSARELVGK